MRSVVLSKNSDFLFRMVIEKDGIGEIFWLGEVKANAQTLASDRKRSNMSTELPYFIAQYLMILIEVPYLFGYKTGYFPL